MLVIVLIVVLMIGVGDTKLIIVLVAALVMLMEGAGDVGVVDGSLATATVNVLLSVLHRCVVSSVITRLWCFK